MVLVIQLTFNQLALMELHRNYVTENQLSPVGF